MILDAEVESKSKIRELELLLVTTNSKKEIEQIDHQADIEPMSSLMETMLAFCFQSADRLSTEMSSAMNQAQKAQVSIMLACLLLACCLLEDAYCSHLCAIRKQI